VENGVSREIFIDPKAPNQFAAQSEIDFALRGIF